MDRYFSLDEARALLPEILEVEAAVIPLRAELAERVHRHNTEGDGALAEIKALEARVSEHLDRLVARGMQVKGYAPILVDVPHRHGDRDLLLCWLEGETELAWYHEVAHGFMGRRPITDLE